MTKKPKILVVGSLVMDLIVTTDKVPETGETVLGKNFQTAPGGKGANQAVQAARLGAEVTMVGKVGNDAYGQKLIDSAKAAGIHTQHILIDQQAPTAVGNILLEVSDGKKSKNRIIVVSGANMQITPQEVAFLKNEIGLYDMVILQLEIPMQINEIIAKYAFDKGVPVMLNPAPSAPLSHNFLSHLTYLSPNEYEAADLSGVQIQSDHNGIHMQDVKNAANKLLIQGVKNVIITLGSYGVAATNSKGLIYTPCVDVMDVIDPTAAGDSFVAAFCVGVCMELTKQQALEFASYTATLTVSRMGAQPSLPKLNEVTALMDRENFKGFDRSVFEALTA